MWRATVFAAMLIAAGSGADQVAGQETSMMDPIDERVAIARGAEALQGYVAHALNEANVSRFGFESLAEARAARLGEPARVVEIGLDALQRYQPGTPVAEVARDVGILWFPVTVEGRTAAKLELVAGEQDWIAGDFGAAGSAERMATVRAQAPDLARAAGVAQPGPLAIMRVPALPATFWHAGDGGREVLIPAMAQPGRFGLDNGRAYTAAEVLARLAEVAREIEPRTLR